MDSTEETSVHIKRVQTLIVEARENLTRRAFAHDASKFEEPEKSAFDRLLALRLSDIPYGSDEYRAYLKAEQPAIQHHYEQNSHHPEHYPEGISGMSLLDLIEMVPDWKAASERGKDGSLAASIEQTIGRFGIEPQLAQIIRNTVREMGW